MDLRDRRSAGEELVVSVLSFWRHGESSSAQRAVARMHCARQNNYIHLPIAFHNVASGKIDFLFHVTTSMPDTRSFQFRRGHRAQLLPPAGRKTRGETGKDRSLGKLRTF